MELGKAAHRANGGHGLRTCVAICVLLAVAILAVYAQVARFGVNDFDDPTYVFINPHVRTGLTAGNVAWALTASHAGNWHPVTWISHMMDVQLFGLSPGPHHVTNVIIHILNSCLLFLILAAITGSVWRSAFVAALFAVHPMNVESVAWIAERKNVLSTTFWLLTIWAYFVYAQRGGIWWYLLLVASFALGLATKPMLVTLPIVMALLDIWPIAKSRATCLKSEVNKLPLLAMAALSCWITVIVQSEGGMTRSLEQFPVGQRVANAIVSYGAYIGKMVWPTNLCVLYPHPKASISVWITVACALGLILATFGAIVARRKRPYVTVGWFWYLFTTMPVIGLVQVGPQAMADRYAYVPFIGLFIIIAWLVPELVGPNRSRWFVVPAVVVLIALGVSARMQAGYWRDLDTVFVRAAKVTGDYRSVIYCKAGALADAGKVDKALGVLRNALPASPEPQVVHNFMGMLLSREGKPVEALDHYRQAIAVAPGYAVGQNNLGTALARLHKLDEAAFHLRKAIELDPDYPDPHHSLGVVLYWQGHKDEAVAQWEKALELNPQLVESRRRLRQVQRGGR